MTEQSFEKQKVTVTSVTVVTTKVCRILSLLNFSRSRIMKYKATVYNVCIDLFCSCS